MIWGIHMTHIHIVSLLIHQNFQSKSSRDFKLFEFRFWSTFKLHVFERAFGPVRRWIKSEILNSSWSRDWWTTRIPLLIHLYLFEMDSKRNFEQFESGPKRISKRNSGWIKRAMHKRHLTISSKSMTGSKILLSRILIHFWNRAKINNVIRRKCRGGKVESVLTLQLVPP